MEKIKSLLPMLPYWRELNERQRELIAKGAFFRRFEQGEHIHGGFGQCYILRGCIRVSVISAQGREISLFRLHSGELYMTHDQIAQQTSSAREVVARRIKMFAAEGLVETRRGAVRLIDIPALRALMCK